MMIKLPTYKQLGINVKKLLWELQPETFQAWKSSASSLFCAKLGGYLSSMNANTKENFAQIYQIIFYHGFINFRRELELKKLLEIKGYKVDVSNMLQDSIFGIDLYCYKNNILLFLIQVKLNNNYVDNLKRIKELSAVRNARPILAFKRANIWVFRALDNGKELELFNY